MGVRFPMITMLFVSSTLLLLVNAGTCSRVKILFNRVAILILLYSGIIYYDTVIGIYGGLFHSTFITHNFALFLCIIGIIVLLLTVYYPRRSQKSMGAMGKKISSFFLTKYTDSYFDIYQNNIIKMWEQFRIIEFPFIILFILISEIFLISSSDLIFKLSTIVGTGFVNLAEILYCYYVLCYLSKFILMLRLIKLQF